MFSRVSSLLVVSVTLSTVSGITIPDIQGSAFASPFLGQNVTGIQGLVTAKSTQGFYLKDVTIAASSNPPVDNGILVFSTSKTVQAQVNVGDIVTLNGKVAEFRSSTAPTDLTLTEIDSPTNITKISSNNTVTPVVLGVDRSPPTVEYTSLDNGNVFGFPNNQSRVQTANLTLQPDKYGLDFWESLEGQLVIVKNPVALGFNVNSFGDFWVHGDWTVTGKNSRGGLTITSDDSGVVDANPEAIVIGSPLDGTKNPAPVVGNGLRMGATLSDIVGILEYDFDTYRVLPLTAPTILSAPPYNPSPTTLLSNSTVDADNCTTITVGDYNIENLGPTATNLPTVASHIANFLLTPDIMFVQEVQDASGETDDGNVSGALTLDTLTAAIQNASSAAVKYSWTQIDPVNDLSGGVPGGNIRPAFLYRPEIFELINGTAGTANDSAAVVGTGGSATLNFNPAVIDPTNNAFVSSRKPLVAQFRVKATGQIIWAIVVHQSSKDGSSPMHGDPRPPINGALNARIAQATVEANFISTILAADPAANIIIAGDFNEFLQTPSVFDPFKDLVTDMDVVTNHDPVERYTYVFDMNSQQLDHAMVSANLWDTSKEKRAQVAWEHIHVNTWQQTVALRGSDHDPSVGKFRVCGTQPVVAPPPPPPPPPPACDVTIGKFCAKPLPPFHDFGSCLLSAAQCGKQSLQCAAVAGVKACASYAETCVKDAAFCTTNCLIPKKGSTCTAFPK